MKVSREQVAKNRLNIVVAASRLFSEKGFDAVTIDEVMKHAGLTRGGFYGYFASKDALIAEASAFSATRQAALPEETFVDYCQRYLSTRHRDNRADGCAFAALATEAIRQSPAVRREMTRNLQRMIDDITRLAPGSDIEARRSAAVKGLSSMLGGLILARLVDDPELSDSLLAANRDALAKVATSTA
ncbi:helix-turn-helix domain-containing protein [Robbsia sp. KACC 23696]|uniref:TetR/AcrR family transcriptional regulator n=1 Tax=Robbsia sp. KACC 23696 TaxID=3149231 RepID=UPI00325C02CA